MDKNKLVNLPHILNDYKPLWLYKDKATGKIKVAQPRNWPRNNYSGLDWSAKFQDTRKDNTPYTRNAPEFYGIQGGEYFFVDVDAKGEAGKAERIVRELNKLGLDTDTFTVRTKSDGLHLYYLNTGINKDIANSVGTVLKNVDIKNKNGYVVGPDATLRPEDWELGLYVIINNVMPIPCNLDMSKSYMGVNNLPVINVDGSVQDMSISITQLLETRKIVKGQRDNSLLRLSGYCAAKSMVLNECKDFFDTFEIEGNEDGEFTFEMFMEKVDRDREKQENTLAVMLKSVVFIVDGQEFYDIDAGVYVRTEAKLKLLYPEKLPVMRKGSENVSHRAIVDIWKEHPDRLLVMGLGYKPTDEIIYEHDDRMYINDYQPSLVVPWETPVSWADTIFDEYKQIHLLTCDNNPEVADIVMSQRAAKVQNLLWKPSWGFVFISDKTQIGKGFMLKIYARLLARGESGLKEATMTDLRGDRQLYSRNTMITIINEPGALIKEEGKYTSNVAETENIKKLFSETSVSSAKFGAERGHMEPVYHIPEMHGNFLNSLEMKENNGRFAPIHTSRNKLEASIYHALQVKIDKGDKGEFMRKLKRLMLDWEINSCINEYDPPIMPASHRIAFLSKSEAYRTIVEAIKHNEDILSSDLVTKQSMEVAIKVLCHRNTNKSNLIKELLDSGVMVELSKLQENAPAIGINENATGMDLSTQVDLYKSGKKRQFYTIRDHEKYQIGKEKCKRNELRSYYVDNFYPNANK